jgi:hypothetical protein
MRGRCYVRSQSTGGYQHSSRAADSRDVDFLSEVKLLSSSGTHMAFF